MADIDRSDELREIWAEDMRREKMAQNGQHPDDPGPPEPPLDESNDAPTLLAEMRDGEWLDAQEFPPLEWAVPGVVPEGYGLIVAPPKKGKSWLVADLGLACAAGNSALGRIPVPRRAVLYMALEDGDRRLQSRFRRIMGPGKRIPRDMHRITKADRRVILGMIEQFLAEHKNDDHPPLVILDTLGRARPPRSPGAEPFQHDYDFGVRLKALADTVPGSTVLAVHHARKAKTEDFVDAVSGTNAVAAAADFVLLLDRQRQSADAILSVTGRDVPEAEYGLTAVDSVLWQLDGTDLVSAAQTAEARRDEERQQRRSDRSLEALKFVNGRDSTHAAELAHQLHVSAKIAGNLLARLYDGNLIDRPVRGLYAPLQRGCGDSGDKG